MTTALEEYYPEILEAYADIEKVAISTQEVTLINTIRQAVTEEDENGR